MRWNIVDFRAFSISFYCHCFVFRHPNSMCSYFCLWLLFHICDERESFCTKQKIPNKHRWHVHTKSGTLHTHMQRKLTKRFFFHGPNKLKIKQKLTVTVYKQISTREKHVADLMPSSVSECDAIKWNIPMHAKNTKSILSFFFKFFICK